MICSGPYGEYLYPESVSVSPGRPFGAARGSLRPPPGSNAGAATNMAFGNAKNPWNDFRDGAIVGGLTSLAGYSGLFGKGPGGYLASNLAGHSVYGMFSGQGPEASGLPESVRPAHGSATHSL